MHLNDILVSFPNNLLALIIRDYSTCFHGTIFADVRMRRYGRAAALSSSNSGAFCPIKKVL